MRIDAHQHFWRVARADYGWLDAAPDALRRDFGPADLAPLRQAAGVDATVLVQAAQTVAETRFLLDVAAATPAVAGVVGWVDFTSPSERATFEELAADPLLVGLRPMVQELPDGWVLQPALAWAFDAIAERGLVFDALGKPRHAREFLRVFERHPDLRVVLDHGLKPDIAAGRFEPWATDLRDLATHTTAACKLSGLLTEAAPGAGIEAVRPYVDHLLDVFGPDRLVWGSDWPVATTAVAYGDWLAMCETLLAGLSPAQRDAVFGGNAARVYRLGVSPSQRRIVA